MRRYPSCGCTQAFDWTNNPTFSNSLQSRIEQSLTQNPQKCDSIIDIPSTELINTIATSPRDMAISTSKARIGAALYAQRDCEGLDYAGPSCSLHMDWLTSSKIQPESMSRPRDDSLVHPSMLISNAFTTFILLASLLLRPQAG